MRKYQGEKQEEGKRTDNVRNREVSGEGNLLYGGETGTSTQGKLIREKGGRGVGHHWEVTTVNMVSTATWDCSALS